MITVPLELLHRKMVEEQLAAKGIRDPRVLEAFRKVPRPLFVPASDRDRSFGDHPLEIGLEQTISQPYMAALMTQCLELSGGEKVLEIGTGSGYQTAILLALGARVFSVERIEVLSRQARENLERAGLKGASLRVGDGTLGWPAEAPFDRVIVTAAAPSLPVALVEELRVGGSMVIPVGGDKVQELMLVHRDADRVRRNRICECVFVKLLGHDGW